MVLWKGRLLPLLFPLRKNGRLRLMLNPVLVAVVLLCSLEDCCVCDTGCCESNSEDTLGSVYGSLVAGNGGGSNGDDWAPFGIPPDAEYITAMIGESIVFNCHVEFPDNYPVPYIVQWDKKGVDIPIHIWYDGYPTHSGEGYEGRVARVNPNSSYGLASLNLTTIRESDRGWYNCKVYFLNRSPPPSNNKNVTGSWYHLDVHAPPRFVHTSDDTVYTKIGKNIILHCRAEGTPPPEIVWYKDSDPVQPSVTISIVNEGTELRISQIKNSDVSDYLCLARNQEGRIHHTIRVLIAGSAVIITPPNNMTKVDGEKAIFPCEWRANPSNSTVIWYRDGIPTRQISSLESRIETPSEGSLIISPVHMDDSGFYECRVSNGIGETQSAVAYLNVEYAAQVTYTPTVQYLPHRLSGVVRCYIQANPPIQFVMWTRDKHLLEPYETDGFAVMSNGSLLIDRVKESHQGMYTCTPYNVHGTKGSSLPMQVIVKEPPKFEITPDPLYQRKLGSSLEIPCTAIAPNGTTSPLITWQRKDGQPLPRDRVRVVEGSLMLDNLHQTDYGEYECVASNEVATLLTSTKVIVEGTRPHAPFNISATSAVFTVTLNWLPGYSGGPDFRQNYVVWYRLLGESKWETVPVTPPGSTRITIRNLSPGKTYQFQIIGNNELGEGHPSEIVNVTTKDILDYSIMITFPSDEYGSTYIPILLRPQGPKPGAPHNLTILETPETFSVVVMWAPPADMHVAVAYYQIQYRSGDVPQWKTLNKDKIIPPVSSYTVKTRRFKEGETYVFRVVAFTATSEASNSEEISHKIQPKDTQRAIMAGLVGGILFFIVAIILAVCAVKICNRRKRRKQEKAYNMVACRLTDARNGGQIPAQPQVPPKTNGVGPARDVTLLLKRAYRWVGRGVGLSIIRTIRLLDPPYILSRSTSRGISMSRPQSISSITLSLDDTGRPHVTQRHHYSPSILQHGLKTSRVVLPWGKGSIILPDVVDESSSDDGGFLAPRPLRYFPRSTSRRYNLLPGSFVPSSSVIRPELLIPRPFASSPLPSRSSSYFGPTTTADLTTLSSVSRFPVLVQIHHDPTGSHQPPYFWKTATTGRFHPQHLPGDPTPPPWEAERIRDNLARDLEYLERQVPPFLRRPSHPSLTTGQELSSSGHLEKSSSSSRFQGFQDRSTSSGFQSASKTTSTLPSGGTGSSGVGTGLGSGGSGGEIMLRPGMLPSSPLRDESLHHMIDIFSGQMIPQVPIRTLPPRTYENWPRRESTPPIYTMARSPSFDIDEATRGVTVTVPVSEASPGQRTLMDMSVDDPYEFDPVIPDTSPEIAYPQPSSTASTSRFKRGRDREQDMDMERRVAAMKEEFFEYRRRQKKRMESEC
ncbi:protein turtle isoform X2 [Folsomia candida]|uniref:protein turtle isoform X2 n=1 Tax=Folsomia candida TaxID=158441 RepID=UPI001604D63C|nr:protein turtle isoform X2 [Folsomia candida]